MEYEANKAARALQVPNVTDELQASIDMLGKDVENLILRLAQFARSEGPSLEAKNPTPTPVLCEYAERLAGKTNQINRIRAQISNLMDRLEI